jgi:hypothetical protein
MGGGLRSGAHFSLEDGEAAGKTKTVRECKSDIVLHRKKKEKRKQSKKKKAQVFPFFNGQI